MFAPPLQVSDEFLALQDRYLKAISLEREIVDVTRLAYRDSMALWQGDITRLDSDAIVNACNPALLGCFQPLHNCIDNVIHSNAGVQVRRDCHKIMQGSKLPNGEVVVTSAYNLPCNFIFHTVGPVVQNRKPTDWIPDYFGPANALVAQHGGKYLARTSSHERLEGEGEDAALRIIIECHRKKPPQPL